MKYLVESGDLEEEVVADDRNSAMEKAIKAASELDDSPSLGLVIRVVEIVGELWYASTERVCKDAGVWEEAQ